MAGRTYSRSARVLLATLLAIAGAHARRLPIQLYSIAQGLPRNTTNCLVPDPRGFLWLCSSDGLVRFDGSDFRTFDAQQGLPSSVVLDFLLAKDGGYWVLTAAGLCRLPPGAKTGDPCRVVSSLDRDDRYNTDSIAEAPDGTVWLVTSRSAYRVRPGQPKAERMWSLSPAHDILEADGIGPGGAVLLSTDHAVYAWTAAGPRQITGKSLECGFGAARFATQTEAWVMSSCGLYRISGSLAAGDLRLEPVRFADHKRDSMASILPRRDGSFWVSAGSELIRASLRDGALTPEAHYGVEEGVPHQWIERLVEDAAGNLWGSVEGIGIFRVAPTGFQAYYEADGLGSARISSLFEDLAGELCVTTSVENLAEHPSHLKVKRGDTFQSVQIRPAGEFVTWGWGWNQFGLQAHDGEWWFPAGNALYRYAGVKTALELDGQAPREVYRRDEFGTMAGVFRVFEDSHHDIWFSLLLGYLIRWERATGHFHRFSAADGWPERAIATVIREAASGTYWIGTLTGELLRVRDRRMEDVHAGGAAGTSPIRDLLIDRAGRVWVATANTGLLRTDNPEAPSPVFRRYTAREGLSSSSVRSLAEDDGGLIYVGTVRGVDRIDPDARFEGGNIRHYTVADGLPDSEQNVAFRDRRGHLWFGTLHGLAEFDPAMDMPLAPSSIYIRRLRVRGEEIPLPFAGTSRMALDLAPDKNQIEIEFAAVDLRAASSLRYQYRLDGVDADWSVPSTRSSVNYANVPPGKRVFSVRIVGPNGEIAENTAGISFALAAPVWQRWWFLTLSALFSAAVVYWLYNYRVQHLLAVERLRTRIATDLHDDIGSSLTQISLLSEVGQRDVSRNVLAEIAQISRDLGREMADIVWAVSPRHDRFEALAHRMRGFAEDALPDGELKFDTAGLPGDLSVPIECRRPVFLVFKEAVNNVARHSRATRLTIRLAVIDGHLLMAVEDNGIGFNPAHSSAGEGLNSIRRRIKNLGGTTEWDTAPGQGTKFRVDLPLKK